MKRPQNLKKISHLFRQNNCFYSVASKQVGYSFHIFVAFSEKLNFTVNKIALPTLSKDSTMRKEIYVHKKNSPLYCVLTAIQNNIGTFAAQKLDGFLRIQTLWRSKVLVLSRFFFRFEFQSWLLKPDTNF